MKRPTQADVARLAGVSRATVSYVMNNRIDKHIPISPETRQRVLDAIAKLGYAPDLRAQSLRSGSTKTVGVLIPLYENPFFWQILTGISNEAEAAGYSVLLSPSSHDHTPQHEHSRLAELAQQRVDGLILLTSFKTLPEPIIQQLRESTKPIVQITSVKADFDCVHDGYAEGTRLLMQHLFDLGHQRIGFIYGVVEASQGQDRLQTYQEILKAKGLDPDLIERCGQRLDDGYQATKKLLSRPVRPTALIVINDLLSMAAVRAALDLGLRIPDELSIAGFDDIPFGNYIAPRLTTVSGNPDLLGRTALHLLLKRIKDPARPQEVIEARSTLIIRESTGPAPY